MLLPNVQVVRVVKIQHIMVQVFNYSTTRAFQALWIMQTGDLLVSFVGGQLSLRPRSTGVGSLQNPAGIIQQRIGFFFKSCPLIGGP